jgi:hypothetical protein
MVKLEINPYVILRKLVIDASKDIEKKLAQENIPSDEMTQCSHIKTTVGRSNPEIKCSEIINSKIT